jgi:hypothetical protein
MSEPERNAAGREIWFRAIPGEGVYRPVTGAGCAVLLAGVGLVLVCGLAMMAAIVVVGDARAFAVGFVPLAIGLALVARTVARHS